MSSNDELLTQFMEVTGCPKERAEFFMESSNWQLQLALSSFFESGPEEENSASVEEAITTEEPSKIKIASVPGPAQKVTKNPPSFATLSTLQVDDDDSDDGQAFYAGGSEHSGQQILGPPRKNPVKDYVSEVFRSAQAGNIEQFDLVGSSSNANESTARRFTGTGYRLGQTDSDHEVVQSGNTNSQRPPCNTVVVRVWRQGFTVDDGPIRPYDDPQNTEFFESITRNEIPRELVKPGETKIHVNLEDHLTEDYVNVTPRFKVFTGSGQTLGSPTPVIEENIVPNSNVTINPAVSEAQALTVDRSQPTTMISIRLADGSRVSTEFNLTHTIQDIRQYIRNTRPQYSSQNFMLLTTFPNKELTDSSETIEKAGLQNAAILQRIK